MPSWVILFFFSSVAILAQALGPHRVVHLDLAGLGSSSRAQCLSSPAGSMRNEAEIQFLVAVDESMAELMAEAFSSSSPPPALTCSAALQRLGVEVAQVPARLAWLESEMRRGRSRRDECRAELVLLEQELPKQYARIAELIAIREQLDLEFPEAAAADPVPAPAVADPDPASERSSSNRASQSKQNSGGPGSRSDATSNPSLQPWAACAIFASSTSKAQSSKKPAGFALSPTKA